MSLRHSDNEATEETHVPVPTRLRPWSIGRRCGKHPRYGLSHAQTGDALVAAAKREGRGTVYSVVDPTLMQAVVKGFKDKYGIEIELVRLTSSSLGQRLSAEVESGNVAADVVIDTDKLLVQAMTAKGYYAPVETDPRALGRIPASAKTAHRSSRGACPTR